MGEHRLKPVPMGMPKPYEPPKFELALGVDLAAMVVPRRNLCIITKDVVLDEVEGKRYACADGERVEIAADAEIRRDDAVTEDDYDVVCLLRFTYTKGSVLLAGNRLPQAKIGVTELGRMSLSEVKRIGEGLIAGTIAPGEAAKS